MPTLTLSGMWTICYLKYDSCYDRNEPAKERYSKMRDALNKTGRPIFYSLCNGDREDVATWGSTVETVDKQPMI